MSIEITQTCDGCKASRRISFGYYGQPRDMRSAAEQGGWRQVRELEHLCSDCIRKALQQSALGRTLPPGADS